MTPLRQRMTEDMVIRKRAAVAHFRRRAFSATPRLRRVLIVAHILSVPAGRVGKLGLFCRANVRSS